ncbi:E3 ubiquitin-protein ligase makorin-like isoform X1 [Vigna umbellata]|uniref:E3 ubiquitin-protein ligase makorin-like isoform X1 n=1 Tax=Vigna umbellata TaxID=87088 RepID=UPI001F5E8485|nr:E3 ubiquitin-protein ligase makorin-like isoform X1 [Vigna umbellata]
MSNRVCKFYARGACLKGDQCDFVHERKDGVSSNICTYYQKGVCAYGSRCRYKHVKAYEATSSSSNGRHPPVSDSVLNQTTKGASSCVPKASKSSSSDKCARSSQHKNLVSSGNDVGQSSSSGATASGLLFCSFAAANCPLGNKCSRVHGNRCFYCRKFCLHPTDSEERENHLATCEKREKYLQALNDSQEVECNVCLERVLSKPKPSDCKFGLLPQCDHAFCLSCIRNWRNSAPTSGMDTSNNGTANTVRKCPVCRKLSYFVIPSGIWYSTKEEKQEIIDNYKANCKQIDCKHFNFGNGNCPFGACCFYKHTVKPGSYTWIHRRPPPPPQRRQNNLNEMLDMLSDVDLTSAEYLSIMRDSDLFDDMDPFGMIDISDRLAGESGLCLGPFDSDEEGVDFFQMAALSEALVSGVDDFGLEDFDDEEFNPMEAALLSMMMHSNIDEDEDEDEEEYSDEYY